METEKVESEDIAIVEKKVNLSTFVFLLAFYFRVHLSVFSFD